MVSSIAAYETAARKRFSLEPAAHSTGAHGHRLEELHAVD